jgi:hydrogenase maturation protein HypF
VARVALGRELVLRRSRGYAPLPVRIANTAEPLEPLMPVLAVGAHLKNAVAISKGNLIFVSQHIGDLETPAALTAFEHVAEDFRRIYEIEPAVVAMDAHPDYLSTQYARRFAREAGVAAVSVQHHFAHVLSCMAENEVAAPALGVAWDGTGHGLDGTVWGGEFFRVGASMELDRFAHLRTFPLPGGEAAVREPRRCALGALFEVMGEEAFALKLQAFSERELPALRTMLRRRINAPRTSSAGRLFDAVASLAGLRHRTAFEGQTAMQLEFASSDEEAPAYPFELRLPVVDWGPMVRAIAEDARQECPEGHISARFHQTLAEIIVDVARASGESRVVLSGGCFQNVRLLSLTVRLLRGAGFDAVWHQRIPPNDGGIALGQAVAVLWKTKNA